MLIINNQEDMDNLNINSIQNVDEIKISNVSVIPEGKFYGLNKLTKVYMNNINIIESGAFMDCKNLKNVSFKNNPKEIQDFAFHNTNISFIPELYENTIFGVYNNLGKNVKLENLSWSEIDKLSKLGKSSDYFNIGDTKSIIYNDEEIYNVQIIGFNHDDLADGSGKAGITFQFKEVMTTKHAMNLTTPIYIYGNNIGGWETSEMRTFINNNIYNLLPFELQSKIKKVNKVSDGGYCNRNLKNTIDKLFLLSMDEVGFLHRFNIAGQGKKYEIYNIQTNYQKFYLNNSDIAIWWLRSANVASNYFFFNVVSYGAGTNTANNISGIAPAFCI